MVCLVFSSFSVVGVALSKTFSGPSPCEDGIDDGFHWVRYISSERKFLEGSLWTPKLECALQRFSIARYFYWLDGGDYEEAEKEWLWDPNQSFTDGFLNYLEGMVSNPWHKIKLQLQLLILIRGNLTFITIIPYVIWNTPNLLSTIPPVERNLPSWALFGLSFRNPSHHYRRVFRLQGGMDYVPLYLGSTPKRSTGIGIITISCVAQQNTTHLSQDGHGTEHVISQSLSCLIGLPVSQFHVYDTSTVRTLVLLRHRASWSPGQ